MYISPSNKLRTRQKEEIKFLSSIFWKWKENIYLFRQLQVTQVIWLVWVITACEQATLASVEKFVLPWDYNREGRLTLVMYQVYLTGEFPYTLWVGFTGYVDVFLCSICSCPQTIKWKLFHLLFSNSLEYQ